MVVFDFNITVVLSVAIAMFTFGTLFWKFGDSLLEYIGILVYNKGNLKKVNDDSSIKRKFKYLHSDVADLKNSMKEVVDYQKNAYWDRMDMKADILSIKILDGIEHDIGHDHIIKMFNEYQNIPQEDGKLRNTYVEWKVKSYTGINEYYKFNDHRYAKENKK